MKAHSMISALALAAAAASPAHAALEASLAYKQPTGTVASNQGIELWVTLSLAASSDPLTFDLGQPYPFGLDPALVPTTGDDWNSGTFNVPFASYTGIGQRFGRYCTGNFTVSCSDAGSAYSIDSVVSGPDSWFSAPQPFTMNAGESRDFLLYVLNPTGGNAPAGDYVLYTTYLGLTVNGLDADQHPISADLTLATACPGGQASCAFTRTVVAAVPEPQGDALLLGGLAVMAYLARRRRAA